MAERLPQSLANEGLRGQIDAAVDRMWSTLPTGDAVATRDALLELAPDVIDSFGDVAATVAGDQYEQVLSQAGIRVPPAQLAGPIEREAIDAGIRWAVGPLFGAEPDSAAARTRMALVADRLALKQSDMTMRLNAERDNVRYAWVPAGPTCAYCTMLASRGPVYRSQDRASAGRHSRCDCSIQPVPVDAVQQPVQIADYGAWQQGLNQLVDSHPGDLDLHADLFVPYRQGQIPGFEGRMHKAYVDYVNPNKAVYKDINRGLRTGDFGSRSVQNKAEAMVEAFDHGIPMQADVVFRGSKGDSFGPSLNIGDTFQDNGIVSTSSRASVARGFTAMYEGSDASSTLYAIRPTAATSAARCLPGIPAEHEWMLPPGSKFRVEAIRETVTSAGGRQRIVELSWYE